MSLLEQDDLPTIIPFYVHVCEPCLLECDINFKLQMCNEVLWTLLLQLPLGTWLYALRWRRKVSIKNYRSEIRKVPTQKYIYLCNKQWIMHILL